MINKDTPLIEEFENIKSEAVMTLSKLINLCGLTFSESRLYSFMFLENNPMTLDEMSQSLGMSKTTMSTGVRSLLDTQIVERTWKKGMRKDLYLAENNLYKVFSNTFIEQWNSLINNNKKSFAEMLKELDELSKKTDDPILLDSISEYSNKIENIVFYYNLLLEVFDGIQNKIEETNNKKSQN